MSDYIIDGYGQICRFLLRFRQVETSGGEVIAGGRGRHAKTNMDIPAVPGLPAVAAADEGGAEGEGEVEK